MSGRIVRHLLVEFLVDPDNELLCGACPRMLHDRNRGHFRCSLFGELQKAGDDWFGRHEQCLAAESQPDEKP